MTATFSKTPLHDELVELDEQVATASQRARALAEEAAAHGHAIEQLKADRIVAYSEDDERKALALRKKATDAEAKAAELEDRRQGAEIAARRTQAVRDAFVVAHLSALVAERTPAARAVVKRIEGAIEDLSEGVAAWIAESQEQAALLRTGGRSTKGIPDIERVRQLARELQRAARDGVVAPLPDSAHIKRAEPEPEPSGDLRDGARAVLRARREAKPDPDDDARPMIEQIG